MIFSNIVRTGINLTAKRYTRKKRMPMKAWPNDWVPFVWNRPVKVPSYFNTGDLRDLGQPEKDELPPELGLSSELKSLNPDNELRKLFSLDHAKRSHYNKTREFALTQKMGLIHQVDYCNSLEAKITKLTHALRHVVALVKEGNVSRSGFIGYQKQRATAIMGRRYRYLCELQELHKDRFHKIIKELDIEPKDNLINLETEMPYRKIQMRRLAINYARDMKDKKVEDFMASLDEEKVNFEKEKQETLKWIAEKEKELGMIV